MSYTPIIFCVIDGLGDEPIPQFDGKTPLEAAQTTHLDALAKEGVLGSFDAVFEEGHNPTSQGGHLALFGYPPGQYSPGRGVLEVLGLQVDIQEGDVCLRGNFGTIGENGTIRDRRAGRISETAQLIDAIDDMEIEGVRIWIHQGLDHRLGIVMRGEGLSDAITDGDHKETGIEPPEITPTDDSEAAAKTARVVNEFLRRSHDILSDHPFNQQRTEEEKLPANYILTRGAGQKRHVPSFQERYGRTAACIAGAPLYKGIGRYLGMEYVDVEGANGLPSTNLRGKFSRAAELSHEYDFVFVHIKAADNLAEDGDWEGKRDFLARLDTAVPELEQRADPSLLVITGDHSTCSPKARHCKEPVPLLVHGNGSDEQSAFGETSCANGSFGRLRQGEVLDRIFSLDT